MWDNVEAVILTGGASSRMGIDKATLQIDGKSQSQRILDQLLERKIQVTSIGRNQIRNESFILDKVEHAGPLIALSQFNPTYELVVILSCDIPLFNAQVLDMMLQKIQKNDDAILISLKGRIQPLFGIYLSRTWESLTQSVNQGETRLMSWVEKLKYSHITENDLIEAEINPETAMSANTQEEFQKIIKCQQQKKLECINKKSSHSREN